MKIKLVTHDYTLAAAAREAERLRDLLRERLGADVDLCTQSDVREERCGISSSDIVYPLLIFRGAGYRDIVSTAKERGARVVPPPPLEKIAEIVASAVRDCSSILLLHPEAGRLETLSEIAERVERSLGAPVSLSRDCREGYECAVVLSLLPGVTSRRAMEDCGNARLIPYLLLLLEDVIVQWFKSNAEAPSYL